MQQALRHLEDLAGDAQIGRAREPLLAAALLHDVGHGPFSHLFEPCLGIDHEVWSKRIIENEDGQLNKALKALDPGLIPALVSLIDSSSPKVLPWMRFLLSSQLDMDRLDYLRRDSLFTGAGYGHFDVFRLINTMELSGEGQQRDIVWPEKAKFAIEEYIFSRYYMYQNVYLHKTTRGFERIVEAIWSRAKTLRNDGIDVSLVPAIDEFFNLKDKAGVENYLRLEEFTVLQQIESWTRNKDAVLSRLSTAFLNRERFLMIEPPAAKASLDHDSDFEDALRKLFTERSVNSDFLLKDSMKQKYRQPYFPEKESDEQSARNAIRIVDGGKPIEVSKVMPRLQPLTEKPANLTRFYVPNEIYQYALALRKDWAAPQEKPPIPSSQSPS